MSVSSHVGLTVTSLVMVLLVAFVNSEGRNSKREIDDKIQALEERLIALEKRNVFAEESDSLSRRTRGSDDLEDTGVFGDVGTHAGHCILCPPGTSGPRGPPGAQGIPGRDGRDGRDNNGCSDSSDNGGDQGGPVDPDPTPRANSSTGGAVFVRWGRSECPSSSEPVYSGIAGGGYYTHKGSGSNYLCMPEEPIYDEPQAGTSGQSRGYIYGAEYEMNTFTQWNDLHDNNVPCVVCYAPSRPSLLMVPARNECPSSDWNTEYFGYLVSAYYNHEGRTEFVCMDKNAVSISRSSHNANGALFYPVEGRCGAHGSGLPCAPYVDGHELTCAVCTR